MRSAIARSEVSGGICFARNAKSLVRVELRRDPLRRRLEDARELARAASGDASNLSGKRPQRLHRRRQRERLAEAVDDAAAMRGHLELARVARAALRLQELVVDPLQVDRAADQAGEQQRERAEHDRRAQPRQRKRRRCGACARAAQRAAPASLRAPPARPACARSRCAPRVGSCMRSCSRAIFSTRAGMPHVDCSSCSWPYSVSYAARLGLRALELDEEPPRLVPRRHERQRARDQHREQHEVRRASSPRGGTPRRPPRIRAASRRAADARCARATRRIGAARARIARDLRGADGLIARPTSASGAPGSAALRIGSRAGAGSPANGCDARAKKRLTMRSSSEWKLITASRPPARSSGTMRGSARRHLRQLRGSRKSEGPGTSAWPDPDPNHPACARRRLGPRSAELPRADDGLPRARRRNCSCNRLSKPFFTIVADDLRQFAHRGAGKEFGGGLAARRVHPHVERTVVAKREAARGVVDLRRGDSEIEQHAVDLRMGKCGEDVGQFREPRAAENESGVAGGERVARRARRRGRGRRATRRPSRPEPREDRARVTAAAERARRRRRRRA